MKNINKIKSEFSFFILILMFSFFIIPVSVFAVDGVLTWTTDTDWNTGTHANTTSESGSLSLCWEGGLYCDWGYRKKITITGSISELTDYVMPVDITDKIYNNTGLVGSWHFTRGSIKDTSGNANDGVISSGIDCSVSGKFGEGCSFDGVADYVNLPNIIHGPDNTISMWIKPKSLSAGQQTLYGFCHDANSNCNGLDYEYYLFRLYDDGSLGGGFLVNNARYVYFTTTPIIVEMDKWYHVVLTTSFTENDAAIYINGEKQLGTLSVAGSGLQTFTYSPTIGARHIQFNNQEDTKYNGIIDEVKIYNRTLSSAEIQEQYESRKARLDLQDLRFSWLNTTNNKEQKISYWLESDNKVWVKVPKINALNVANTIIYMYSGNSTVITNSKESTTFYLSNRNFDLYPFGRNWTCVTAGSGACNAAYTGDFFNSPNSGYVYETAKSCSFSHLQQTITLPDISPLYLHYNRKYWCNSWGSGLGIKINATSTSSSSGTTLHSWGCGGRSYSSSWGEFWDDISAFKGQTVLLEMIYHDYTDNDPAWCHMWDHGAWLRVDDLAITTIDFNLNPIPIVLLFGAEESMATGIYTSNITNLLNPIVRVKAMWNVSRLGAYKKEINFSNVGDVLTDYQVKLIIDNEPQMNADYSDLRFTDIYGNLIPYWIEESNSVNATVWIKANFLAFTNTTVNMYYGNVGVNSESDDLKIFYNIAPLINGGSITDSGVASGYTAANSIDEDNSTVAYFKTDTSEWLIRDFSKDVYIHAMRGIDSSSGNNPYVYLGISDDGSSWTTIGQFDEDIYGNEFSTWFYRDEKHRYSRWFKTGSNWYSVSEWEIIGFIPSLIEPIQSSISSEMLGDLSVEFTADGTNWLEISNNTNYTTGGGIGSGTNIQYRVNLIKINISQSPELYDIALEYDFAFNSCGILSDENGQYLLNSDVSSLGTCFTIAADNITLDCQGHTINYSQSVVGYGVEVNSGSDNLTIKNCNIVQGSDTDDSYAIDLSSSWDSRLLNNTITTVGNSSYGIYFSNSKNITVYDTRLFVADVIDIYVSGTNNYKNYIINSTFDVGEIYFNSDDSGSIDVLWYLDVYVKDSIGTPIVSANVTVWQDDGTFEFSIFTNPLGNMGRHLFMDFMQNKTDTYSMDYMIDTKKYGYMPDSRMFTSSSSQLITISLFINEPPQITIESPLNSLYNHQTVWFNISVTDDSNSIDWCGYSLNGAENVTLSNDSVTHFSFLNDTVYVGSYDVVFYCNDSYGVLNNTAMIYFEVVYDCRSDLECSASGDICLFNGCVSEGCTDYCTTNLDLSCHSECDDVNGCDFFDANTKTFCDGKSYGQWFDYGAGQVINCCEGTPMTSYKPDVTYAGLNPLTVALGEVSDVVVSIRNRNDFSDTFTVSLESASNLRYWSWFATHKNDEKRLNLDVSFKPYEQKFISLKVMGATDGCFKGGSALGINVTTSFGKSEKEYVEVCMVPSKTSRSSSRNVPGLGGVGFVILILMSLVIYNFRSNEV